MVVHDADVFVANCEAGLRRGVWQTNQPVEFSQVTGPWFSDETWCNPTELAVIDEVLVLSGERLDFARFCD